MSAITVDGFLGENRAIHPQRLNEKVGTLSNNQKLTGKPQTQALQVKRRAYRSSLVNLQRNRENSLGHPCALGKHLPRHHLA